VARHPDRFLDHDRRGQFVQRGRVVVLVEERRRLRILIRMQ
jgi:hypothetical protein